MDNVEDDQTRRTSPAPYLPHELIVSEILVRLPVKSLLRFSCVCKAWRHTVSTDTFFSQAHVRQHQLQKGRSSSLLIAPCMRIVDDDDDGEIMFANPGLYHLGEGNQLQDGVATLVHDMAWFPAAHWIQRRHGFAHCNGLLMLPDAEGTVHVLNPATRRSQTLPWSSNSTGHERWLFEGPNAYGFGRDPSSGVYKVARFFGHDLFSNTFGMEVFTVGEDRCWHETAAKLLYPFIEGRTATFFKGSLIWTIDLNKYRTYNLESAACFVRFSLEDESFNLMAAPQWYSEPDQKESRLAELHGELALTRLNKGSVEIWMCDGVGAVNPPLWARHHILDFPSCIHPIAAFDDGIVFRDRSYCIWRHTSEGSKHMVDMKALKYRNPNIDTPDECSSTIFNDFDVIPYIPTLVSI